MKRLLLLTGNALRSILHARSLYLWLLAALLVTVQLLPLVLVPNLNVRVNLNPAQQARAAAAIQNRRPNTLASSFNSWSILCIVFGIVVGANALSTEVEAKTIITVLARPVVRWELLFGKWIAIQIFAIASMAVGLVFFKAAGSYFDVTFSNVVWMAIAHTLIATMLYSAAAITLSTILSPALAGALAVLLAFLPGLITFLVADTDRMRHYIGVGLDYIVPPGYSNLFALTVQSTTILDYTAQSKTLAENFLYCTIFFILGCILFTKREIQLG
jgi:ABC-type transport system involved in multi-copper enzyme maturation permease subunit